MIFIFSKYKKMSSEEYSEIINLPYEKYKMADTFDFLIKNCLQTGDEEMLKFICENIAKKVYYKAFREMKMKIPLLCEEVIKNNPYNLLAVPYSLQTLELCILAMELSKGHYFCFVNPALQTYELALKCIEFDGKNLKHVRNDLIDENMINTALKENGEAVEYVKKSHTAKLHRCNNFKSIFDY